MAKKLKVKEKYKVFMTYEETRSGGEKEDPDDRWSSREDEEINFTPVSLFANSKGDFWVETIEVDFNPQDYIGKKIDVVIVIYSDGDTFGTTLGNWQVTGAYPNETKDALNIAKSIELNKYDGCSPWNGYLANFSSIGIHTFTLQGIIISNEPDNLNSPKLRKFEH